LIIIIIYSAIVNTSIPLQCLPLQQRLLPQSPPPLLQTQKIVSQIRVAAMLMFLMQILVMRC